MTSKLGGGVAQAVTKVEGGRMPSLAETPEGFQRLSPMRPGRPPGWRRRPDHPVYEVLNDLQGLAFWALERPDTS